MVLLLTLSLLLVAGTSLNTYSISVNQNSAKTDYFPRTSLGTLTSGDVITFDIFFPRITGINPTSYQIRIYDSTPTKISPQPATFDTTTSIGNNSHTWTVGTSGLYYVEVEDSGLYRSLVLYYLTITHSNGSNYSKI